MSPTEPVALVCPLCDCRFEAQRVTEYAVGEKESDFCPRYLGLNPLPFLVHACPECAYVGYERDFAPIEAERMREKLKRTLGAIANEPPITGTQRYRRLALLMIYRGVASLSVADAYLKASWCARIEGEVGEARCQQKALKYFELALAAHEVRRRDRPLIVYLIGELARRLGDFRKARAMFERVAARKGELAWLGLWRELALERVNADVKSAAAGAARQLREADARAGDAPEPPLAPPSENEIAELEAVTPGTSRGAESEGAPAAENAPGMHAAALDATGAAGDGTPEPEIISVADYAPAGANPPFDASEGAPEGAPKSPAVAAGSPAPEGRDTPDAEAPPEAQSAETGESGSSGTTLVPP